MPFEAFFHNHESLLAFYVNGHIFCLADIDANDSCAVKCSLGEITELEEKYSAVGMPYNFSPKHWISIKFNGDVPDDVLLALVKESYMSIASGK